MAVAHRFGTSAQKAAMIEGPDRIAIELVEVAPHR